LFTSLKNNKTIKDRNIDLDNDFLIKEDKIDLTSEAANIKSSKSIDPNFVTGFSDAEGHFGVVLSKSSTYKIG
jgi:hypothetical protein